ncbi:MAG: tetratricopeptide repeat protein [Candidatus Nitricoxidivorans perseverans]|uniref:Tetratricopeptide repeat protein n=1 Tax=Candidatus Nitricoxidivorans perseverans TaxID=2975601 RepID=A0AA49FNN0_9PROT|nr:MAG: tetratricopeptide repeat protein [Candidatus Nitricoxidivorans perseverans]
MTLRRSSPTRVLAFAVSFALAAALPAHADSLQDIGKLVKQGQHAQALDQVDRYLAGKPKDAQGRFMKGLIFTEMNRPNDAIAVFQKLTEDYPELPEPYNNLAVIYAQQKQYEKAKQALEMAIRTHPSYATAHENLGDIYARLASQAYDKALQIDSSNASAQTKLAVIRDLMSVASRSTATRSEKPQVAAAEQKPAKLAEAAKPVEAKAIAEESAKSAEPSLSKPAPAAPLAEATKAVESWAAAWSKKDVKGYLDHYAKDFQTPGGESRADWESERSRRIGKPGDIQVSVENLRVTADGPDKAMAKFRQHYRSAAFKTSTNKVLVLIRRDDKWLIQQERIGK